VWCATAALLGLILPDRIFPQESQPVSLYALASSDITDIEEKLSWQDAINGWSVASAPAGLVPSGGEGETPSGNRRPISIEPARADEPPQAVVERRVRGRNWYHAYALEHAYIQPTAVFAQLTTAFEVHITAGAEEPRVRLVPHLHYNTGTYDGDIHGKQAALEVRVPRGQCLLARPSEALAKRLLDLLAGEEGIFLLCGVSGESASAEEPSTGKR
jgi:hypothetical protein